jgi:predicted negative regulator of RcsB-dependent stress response
MTAPFTTEDRTDSLMEWFQLHTREFAYAAGIVVLLGAGGWFYIRSRDLKAERAEKAYYTAARSATAGNLPLAESDLRKMIERYDGTPAAAQARLQLAQILYDQGKYQAGVEELRLAEDKIGKTEDFGSGVHLVMAAGLEQLKKFKDAGEQYEKAAKVARFDADRQRFMSMAASAYMNGGDKAKAKQIWTDLAADSKGAVAGEARVRLGELTATPEPKA